MKVDPIKFEVIRNGFLEATEEMAVALRRSAYSTNIKTRCDFSCCFFDRDLRPIAQSFSQPTTSVPWWERCAGRSWTTGPATSARGIIWW